MKNPACTARTRVRTSPGLVAQPLAVAAGPLSPAGRLVTLVGDGLRRHSMITMRVVVSYSVPRSTTPRHAARPLDVTEPARTYGVVPTPPAAFVHRFVATSLQRTR